MTQVSILRHLSPSAIAQQLAPSYQLGCDIVDNPSRSLGILLGRNIAKRRKAMGLTQSELAERLGLDTVTVSRFERGTNLPSLQRLLSIADLLEMPLAELLSQSGSLSSDQALQIHGWIEHLPEAERQFVLDMVKAWCEKLASK